MSDNTAKGARAGDGGFGAGGGGAISLDGGPARGGDGGMFGGGGAAVSVSPEHAAKYNVSVVAGENGAGGSVSLSVAQPSSSSNDAERIKLSTAKIGLITAIIGVAGAALWLAIRVFS